MAHAKEAVQKFQYACFEMGTFNAQSVTPQDFDARQVKDCDVYIAILGMRYGTIFSEGISHTEHEYNTAYEQNKKIYVFILDENSIDHNIPINMLNSGETHKNQEDFKNKVKINHVVKLFKNADNLHSLISDILRDLEQTPPDWNWPIPWDFGPYRAERCHGFYGRKWLFEKIRDWAQNPEGERALLLTADYGVGKTAFLAKLITDQLSGLPLAAEHFCQGGINDTLSPGRFVRSVAAQLAISLPSYRMLLQAREASDLQKLLDVAAQKPIEAWDQVVVALLHRIPTPETHHLLVVDALDVALGYRPTAGEETNVTIVKLLSRNSTPPPSWLRILATSRQKDDVTNKLKTCFKHDDKILLDEDSKNINDLHEYTVKRSSMEKLFTKLAIAELQPLQVAEYLSKYDKSSGKFLYVESILKALEEGLIPLKDINDIMDLPPGMNGFYNLAFENGYTNTEEYEPARQILGIMCEAREPLGYKELAAIIGCNQKDISRHLEPLETLLKRRTTTDVSEGKSYVKKLVYFEHVSLPQWLSGESDECNRSEEKYLVDRDWARKKIREWILTEVDKDEAHKWSYLARHLISYLNKDDHALIIPKLLRSFDWIQARLENTSINILLNDFNLVEVSDALHEPAHMMLRRALGQSEQILRNHFNQLPSQLLARLGQNNYPDEISSIVEGARKKAASTGQAIPLTPSLFNPQLFRWNSIPIPYNSKMANTDKKCTCLCLSSDNEFVFFGLNDGSICSWVLSSGSCFWSTDESAEKAHKGEISAIVELPDGRIATASRDGNIILWDRFTLKFITKLEGHTGIINDLLVVSYRSNWYLVSASDDQRLGVWDIKNNKKYRHSFINYPSYPRAKSETEIVRVFSFADSILISLSKDGLAEAWDINKRKRVNHIDLSVRAKYLEKTSFPADVHSLCSLKDESACYSLKGNPIIYRILINNSEPQISEIGYHDSPIHCLALSSDNSSLASASIKIGADDEHLLKISIWDPVIKFSPIQQPHRNRVELLATFNNQNSLYSFSIDGSVCIFDSSKPGLLKSHFRLNDFSESEFIPEFCCFYLSDTRFVVRKGSGLVLYSVPPNTDLLSDICICLIFDEYEQLRPAYVPTVVINTSKYGLIFGCKDGSIIYKKLGVPGTDIEKFTAVKDGSVEFLTEYNEDELLYWTNSPSTDEVFLICSLITEVDKPQKINSFKIRNTDDSSQLYGNDGILNFLRPLRAWVDNKCIAISQPNFIVSIWEWNNDGTNELSLLTELRGHKGVVIDCQQLVNGDYITISHDKTVRVWQEKGYENSPLLDNRIIFMGDFPFTALYLCTKTNHVIVGDEMGNIHWLELNLY